MTNAQSTDIMQIALEEAQAAAERNEVPIGAVLTDAQGHILARNGNRTRELNDPTAHAEILVIREACAKAGAQRIPGTTLYVTLEPCTQCAAAIAFARVSHLVFAAPDPKGGAVINGVRFFDSPSCHHKMSYEQGLMAEDSTALLRDFFRQRR